MLTFMVKHFIKDNENVTSPNVRNNYGVLCGAMGIFLNILLFAGKFFAGMISNSIAITADAFNNLSDAGSSVITLIGFKMAGQKPDPDHPFGHGRIEYLSGLFVSIAILIMAVELIRSSFNKIWHPSATTSSPLIIAILLISILIKLYMYYYNHSISIKINSAAMGATATDSLSDTIATTVVLIAAIVSKLTKLQIDGYCGLFVGIFILWVGVNSARDTLNPLLGQPPSPEFVKGIEKIVLAHKEIIGVHDLVVHDYGPGRVMISLHAEVPAKSNILELHDIIDNVEVELHSTLNCSAVIHMDPIMNEDAETNEFKQIVLSILKEIDENLTMHDFRIVKGSTHTNLIFDIVAPFFYPIADDKLKKMISEEVRNQYPTYYCVINIDKSYVL